MAPSNAVSYIHPIYRLFFQKIEPVITLWTGYVNLRNHALSGSLLFNKISSEDDYYLFRDQFVLEQMLGLMVALMAMAAIVMYYADDIRLWRRCQLVLLVWNLACLKGTSDRTVECIYCVELCTALVIIRLMFLFNVGNRARGWYVENGVLKKMY
ncbi:hypothetical protein MKX08_000573 [Trichoderma sp. CBMAI-0020]|nr:hypothetical protein MKX08_000573 [Trichoderma sp. CBMAI-0020]